MIERPAFIWTACFIAAVTLTMAVGSSLPKPSSIDDCMKYDLAPAIAFFAVFIVSGFFVIASQRQAARLVLFTAIVLLAIAQQFGIDAILRTGWTVCSPVS